MRIFNLFRRRPGNQNLFQTLALKKNNAIEMADQANLAWWYHYHPRSSSKGRWRTPKFKTGDYVILKRKPDRFRAILDIIRHEEREEWVYKRQHFKRPNDNANPAYWFEDQLEPASLPDKFVDT